MFRNFLNSPLLMMLYVSFNMSNSSYLCDKYIINLSLQFDSCILHVLHFIFKMAFNMHLVKWKIIIKKFESENLDRK